MFLSMDNTNYMSNENHFKDIGTFLFKKSLMPSHVTRNALDDRLEQCSVLLYGSFWSQPEVSIFKNG